MSSESDTESKLLFESKLIEEIEKYPVLYNKKHPNWRKPLVKDIQWANIASAMNLDGEDAEVLDRLKKQWETLRKGYTQYLNRLSKIPTGSGAKDHLISTFRHSVTMEFYKAHYKQYNSSTIVENYKSNNAPPPSPSTSTTTTESNDERDSDIFGDVFDESEIRDFTTVNNTRNASSSATDKKQGTKRKNTLDEEFLTLYKKKLEDETNNSKQDEFHHFGVIVADRLRSIKESKSADEALDVELKILQLFSE